jgi:hypothetical protein
MLLSKHRLPIGFTIITLIFVVSHVIAQTQLDRDFAPLLGTDTMSVETWEENPADYTIYSMEDQENDGLDVSTVDTGSAECAGFTTTSPAYNFEWIRSTVDEESEITLFFIGDDGQDTTLALIDPDGDWLCADDWETTVNPYIEIPNLRTGSHTLWIGTQDNEPIGGNLYVTVGDYTPDNPPTEPVEFEALFQGSGVSQARLTYVETEIVEDILSVSVDVILTGTRGDEFRVSVLFYDTETDSPLAASPDAESQNENGEVYLTRERPIRLRDTEERYDYGERSRGAVEFEVELSTFDDLPDVLYPVIIVESLNDEDEWEILISYQAEDSSVEP